MRFVSYVLNGRATYGVATNAGVIDAGSRVGERYPDLKAAIAAGALEEIADLCDGESPDTSIDDLHFLPAVPNPGKVFCVGVNYEAHRKETGRDSVPYPTIFTRFADTLVGHGQPIVLPRVSTALDYECELAVIIGKRGRHVDRADAMKHVAGYSCFNDGSVRDWQNHTSQFTPGKNFPATGGFGPYLVTRDTIADVSRLDIRTRLNGEIMQESNTDLMIFDIPSLIEYLSAFTTLAPGDVIATGTPGGVGFRRDPVVFMKPGDEVIVEIESVGRLRNEVVADQASG